MKHLLIILAALTIGTMADAQSLDYTTHTMISKRTASWCSNCGRHGWDMKESVLAASADRPEAMLLSVHISGDYANETSRFFTDYVGGNGQPQFLVDQTVIPFSASTIPSSTDAVMSAVDDNLAVQSVVGLDVQAVYTDDMLTVEASYAYEGADAYSMGVYTVRNNFVGPQAARGSDAVHQRLLWDYLTDNVEGESLADNQGTYRVESDLMELGGHPADDTQILVVVWRETATGREYVNGRLVDIQELIIDTEEVVIEDLLVQQTGTELLVSWSGAVTDVSLVSMNGSQIARKATQGQQSASIITEAFATGVYVLTLVTAQGPYSQQVLIK